VRRLFRVLFAILLAPLSVLVFGLAGASVPHGPLQDVLLILMVVFVIASFVIIQYDGVKASKQTHFNLRQGLLFLGLYILLEAVVVFTVWGPASGFLNQVANDIGPAGTGNQWRDTFIEVVGFLELFVPAFTVLWLVRRYSRKRASHQPTFDSPRNPLLKRQLDRIVDWLDTVKWRTGPGMAYIGRLEKVRAGLVRDSWLNHFGHCPCPTVSSLR
jgi:hypothetical protein